MKIRKPKRFKRKRPLYVHRSFWMALLAALAASLFSYLLFFSPVFEIRNVRVEGDSETLKESIAPFLPRGNLLLLNAAGLQKELQEKFPEIGELKIQRKLFHEVAIKFQQRVEVAAWCGGENCLAIDKEGVVFPKPEPEKKLMFALTDAERSLRPGEHIMEQGKWQVLLGFKERAENFSSFRELNLVFISLEVVSGTRANWTTSENWEVYINPKENLDWQLLKLQAVLGEQISKEKRPLLSYIDLRFGDQAYIQYR